MNNYVGEGDRLEVTAPYALSSGDGCLVGAGLFGVAMDDYGSGAQAVLATEGVFDLAKEAPLVISAGDFVYWDNSAKELDKTATNVQVGVCVEAAASADTTVRVKLFGSAVSDT